MTTLERPPTAARSLPAMLAKRGVILAVALLTLATLATHEAYVLRPHDPEWAHLAPFRWWLAPHVLGGAIALLLAPLQFSSTLRGRYPAVHRWLGRTYMTAAIIASSLSVYIVVRFEVMANWWAMGTMGGLWLITTVLAWLAARNRDFRQHQLWVGRSVCLTLTFVATRFVPDILLPGLDYVNMTALYWLFIVLSLIVPDLVLNARSLAPWRRSARVT